MLGPRPAVSACRLTSSVTASGNCVASAIAVTRTSIGLVTCSGRMMTPSSSSQATAKYAAKIQATWSNVLSLGFRPKTSSAIDGTQISARNSSTGQLRSVWCRTQSPSGSRSLTGPAGRGGTGAGARVGIIVISSLALGSTRHADRDRVHQRGQPVAAEEPQPDERRLEEEREQPLHRERGAEDIAHEHRVARPVHAELELLDELVTTPTAKLMRNSVPKKQDRRSHASAWWV